MSNNNNVTCNVGNCKYYKNNSCSASNINIAAQGDGIANTNEGTICSTFKMN